MIKLLLSDVDGTLVRSDKSLSDASVAAVRALDDAGVHFAVTSGRPPRGMEMLVDPLSLRTPLAAFNGGLVVEPGVPAMNVLEERTIPDAVVAQTIEIIDRFEISVWVYRGADWLVRDPKGPHVEREAHTVQFPPTVVDAFDAHDGIAKIVGVSDDFDVVVEAEGAARAELGDHVSASRSQPYYLDVTHPQANKGAVVDYLARRYSIDVTDVATIGDMPNDVLMFARSGVSIAMGNAHREVQRAARHVTTTNDEDGFAEAVHRYVLNERST